MDYVAAVSNGLGYCLAVEKLLERGSAAARAGRPRDPHGAEPHREPPAVAGHARARYRRHHAGLLLPPRARGSRSRSSRSTAARASPRTPSASAACSTRPTTASSRSPRLLRHVPARRWTSTRNCSPNNRIWVGRLKDVGILNAEECKEYGVTGPVLRAAGVKWDLRKAQPYSGYEKYDFEIPTRAERRHLRPVHGAHGRDAPDRCASCGRRWTQIPEGPIMGKVGKVIKPPVGRGLRFDRSAQGRARLLRGERRNHAAVPRARAAAVVRQSAGARPDGSRRPGGGRGGDHRHAGYRAGRGGSIRILGEPTMRQTPKNDLPGGPVPGSLGDVPQSASEVHLHGAVSGGAAAKWRSAIAARRGSTSIRITARRSASPATCARWPARRTLIVVTSERNEATQAQGSDHFHLRHFALHVLRPVRGRLPGGRAGTDAGFRDGQLHARRPDLGPADARRRAQAHAIQHS